MGVYTWFNQYVLYNAASKNDIEYIKWYFETGFDQNELEKVQNIAMKNGYTEMLKCTLKYNVDLNEILLNALSMNPINLIIISTILKYDFKLSHAVYASAAKINDHKIVDLICKNRDVKHYMLMCCGLDGVFSFEYILSKWKYNIKFDSTEIQYILGAGMGYSYHLTLCEYCLYVSTENNSVLMVKLLLNKYKVKPHAATLTLLENHEKQKKFPSLCNQLILNAYQWYDIRSLVQDSYKISGIDKRRIELHINITEIYNMLLFHFKIPMEMIEIIFDYIDSSIIFYKNYLSRLMLNA